MNQIKDSPSPLKRKMFLSVLIGTACLLIGGIICIYTKDKIMFCLSLTVFIFSIIKALNLYNIISKKKYETIEGTCIGITPKPLRKFRKIQIIDNNGHEISLFLNKQLKIKIGQKYQFYFKQTQHISVGSDYFDTILSSYSFLGYEVK